MFQYKGYTGEIEIDIESEMLVGRVIDIKDVVSFRGKTVEETRQAFEESVDDYLEFCTQLGEEPDKPFSGKLPFRTSGEHHRKIFLASRKVGKSINAWMDETLVKAAEEIIRA
ncbi:type II toxin-antitoxin system HicB family antitoxin [Scytonema tolypothrichoides VB-61278]|nr:type II toxin-antitoxin system HicB family antitoxin [Scytonema tolypothrichoides VB-61278]